MKKQGSYNGNKPVTFNQLKQVLNDFEKKTNQKLDLLSQNMKHGLQRIDDKFCVEENMARRHDGFFEEIMNFSPQTPTPF